MVKVWNYAKTPSRGAAECVMYLDDVEIFRGPLREAEPAPLPSPLPLGVRGTMFKGLK